MIPIGTVITSVHNGFHVVVSIEPDSVGEYTIVNYQQIATVEGRPVNGTKIRSCNIINCVEVTRQMISDILEAEFAVIYEKIDRLDMLFEKFFIKEG